MARKQCCSQSVPERCGERAKSHCGAGSRGGQRLSQGCLHPRGPPRRLATALTPIPRAAGKERLVMESDGKLFFLLPGLFALPELIAGEEGLSGVTHASAEILALISQTCKPSVDSFSAGSRGQGMPWNPPPLSCPDMALWIIHVPLPRAAPVLVPAVPRTRSHAAGLAFGGKRARSLEICDTARPNPTALPQAATPDQSAQSAPAPMVSRVLHTPSHRSCTEIRNSEEFFIINSWFCPKAC